MFGKHAVYRDTDKNRDLLMMRNYVLVNGFAKIILDDLSNSDVANKYSKYN